jgi:hypothetical protein
VVTTSPGRDDSGIPRHNSRHSQPQVSTNVKYTHRGFKTAFRLMADDDKALRSANTLRSRRSSSNDSP